jgi:IS5 family transposase
MKKRPSVGLFDDQRKRSKLAMLSNVLVRLKASIDWESFRPILEEAFPVRDPRKGGQPPYDRLLLFKMLVLGRVYQLSHEALEYQVNDRRSFQEFLDLEPQHEVPDSTTLYGFASHLAKSGSMPKLFAHFHQRLSNAGLVLNEGKIVDASIVNTPVQRNSREENEKLRNGEVPQNWSAGKARQKDLDADWTQKHGKSYFGYKNHVKVDAGSKLIDHYEVTPASVHDSQVTWDLLDPKADKGQEMYADKAYDNAEVKKGIRLAKMKCRVLKSARRNKPLTRRQQAMNDKLNKVRARVEHIFGAMEKQLGGLRTRAVGLVRATFNTGLTNLCYNMLRTLTLLSTRPMVGIV